MSGVKEIISPAMPREIGAGRVSSFARPQPFDDAEVALSITALDAIDLSSALALLDGKELDRARRITCEDYRQHVVKARALLRLMLARHTGAPPRSFAFDEGGGMQPCLRVNPWQLRFSVSHSGAQVAVAISSGPVGIDIERLDTSCAWQPIAETCFHPAERELLGRRIGPAAREAFFDIWTRKEAYLKAIGTPFDTDPASFSAAVPDAAVTTGAAGARSRPWYTRAIAAPSGYRAALASRWQQPRLIRWQFEGVLAGPGTAPQARGPRYSGAAAGAIAA